MRDDHERGLVPEKCKEVIFSGGGVEKNTKEFFFFWNGGRGGVRVECMVQTGRTKNPAISRRRREQTIFGFVFVVQWVNE